MAFNQLAPTVNTILNTSNCLVFGNTVNGTALSVQQLGTGNVATFRTTTGSTALFVAGSGNVGVGTTNPTSRLHVQGGDIYTTSNINGNAGNTTWRLQPQYVNSNPFPSHFRITNGWDPILGTGQANYGAVGINLNSYQGGSKLEFYTSATNNAVPTQRMVIAADGKVGIGTTVPQNLLHIMGEQRIQGLAGGTVPSDYWKFVHNANATTDYGLNISNATTIAMSFKPSTSVINVGIGTATPGTLLDIWGGTSPTTNRTAANSDAIILSECTNDTNYAYVQFRSNTAGTPKYAFMTLKNSVQSNQFWICANNGYTTGVYLAQNGVTWSSSSDARLKNIIEPISNAISKVDQLSTVIYSLKSDETNQRRVGVIAQDVYKVLPEATDSSPESDQMMGVQYSDLIPLALAAIKELSAKNTELEQSLATATVNISSLEARLAALEAKLNSV